MTICLVHGALVALLQINSLSIVPHASSLVAGLFILLAPYDVKNQGVTRHLLVVLDFDDISNLNICPIAPMKAFVALCEDKFLYRLAVDVVRGLSKFLIVP